jgi:hypothetical protein
LWASDAVAQATSKYANVTAAALADAPNLSPTPTVSGPISGADANGNSYVDVTVTYEFQMMTSYLGFSSKSLARTVRMRVAPAVPN